MFRGFHARKCKGRHSCLALTLGNTEEFGAGDEIRTHDPYLGKVMLYP